MTLSAMPRRVSALVTENFGTHRGLARFLLGEAEYILGRVDCFLEPPPEKVSRLVFVCLGNINRSAFAEAVSRRLGARSASFGLASSKGQRAYVKALAMAPLFGIDLSEHRTTDLAHYENAPGDLLVTMEIRHAKQLLMAGRDPRSITLLGHWASPHRIHIHDPHSLSDEYFRTCFTIIQSGVTNLVDYLRKGDSRCLQP